MSWICANCETENDESLKQCEVCNIPRLDPYDVIRKKYNTDRYTFFIRYRPKKLLAADNGDASSQYDVACWFRERKDKTAIHWFEKAANSGHQRAQYDLAWCYLHGELVNRNINKAVELFKSSNLDIPPSELTFIGYYYDIGDGTSVDKTEAMDYYRKAASQGDATAMYNIGVFYENGIVVYKSVQEALDWYKKAADKGCTLAQDAITRINNTPQPDPPPGPNEWDSIIMALVIGPIGGLFVGHNDKVQEFIRQAIEIEDPATIYIICIIVGIIVVYICDELNI